MKPMSTALTSPLTAANIDQICYCGMKWTEISGETTKFFVGARVFVNRD